MINSIPVIRGDIWLVSFDPQVGDEIQKIRPAVVMSQSNTSRYELHIVVPITTWKPIYENDFWMIELLPTIDNSLKNHSAANAFQVKCLSSKRFINRIGRVSSDELYDIAGAIALCVGFRGV